jgi:aspartate carbamoyltransferase catalytic subunit
MQQYEGWEDFHNKSIDDKIPLFTKSNGDLFDLIYAQQFSRNILEELFRLAEHVRNIAKTPSGINFLGTILSDKRAMLFFVQPSTRTFLSFLNACQVLGIKISEIRDASTSSEVKGESPEDMIRTFSSYVDLIIIRHFDAGFAERAAWTLNTCANRSIPVISGGSGKDQHPTQALLDMYTLQRAFKAIGGIDGKKIAMVGDLKRGRTVRSLCQLLALYKDVELFFVSPKEFAMRDDIIHFLEEQKVKFTITDNFEKVIPQVDAIYSTRVQDEHDIGGESSAVDYSGFCFKHSHLSILQDHAVILHPFPRRDEIEVSVDKDPRALYWKQARNGMWARIALILKIFDRDGVAWQYGV